MQSSAKMGKAFSKLNVEHLYYTSLYEILKHIIYLCFYAKNLPIFQSSIIIIIVATFYNG